MNEGREKQKREEREAAGLPVDLPPTRKTPGRKRMLRRGIEWR